MKATDIKATVVIETDLDKDLSAFQSTEAKHELELITIAVEENRTEIVERQLNNGTIMITISEASAAKDVVKSLELMDYMARIVVRKDYLLDLKKKRKEAAEKRKS
jgi:hypothetical protein